MIYVRSRLDAERMEAPPAGACISIGNPSQSDAKLQWAPVTRLGFHDAEQVGGGFTVMSLKDAKRVYQFIGPLEKDTPILVHCEAGASRSLAVAIMLGAWLGRPVNAVVDVYSPNKLVIRKMRQQAILHGLKTKDWALVLLGITGPGRHKATLFPDNTEHCYF